VICDLGSSHFCGSASGDVSKHKIALWIFERVVQTRGGHRFKAGHEGFYFIELGVGTLKKGIAIQGVGKRHVALSGGPFAEN